MVAAVLGKRSFAAAVDKSSFDGQYTPDSVIVTLAVAMSLYNSLEMVLLISATFKRWRGLYFWSLSLCNLGVILYALGMMMDYFLLGALWLAKSLLDIGWILMIICQSLVLYSRLGLIVDDVRILRAVKWMIILTSLLVLPTVIVLDFGTTYSRVPAFSEGYFYIEHTQMVVISLQELLISGLYVWKTASFLKIITKTQTRSMVWQLFAINVIIIVMDIALIVLQYKHFQLYQESIKGFVYSVKLKLEINILSKLVGLVHGNASSRSMTLDVIDSNAIPGQVQAEVRDEFIGPEDLSRVPISNDDGTFKHNEDGHATQPRFDASCEERLDEKDGIMPAVSHSSRYSSRTSGRESDVLYADFLRALR